MRYFLFLFLLAAAYACNPDDDTAEPNTPYFSVMVDGERFESDSASAEMIVLGTTDTEGIPSYRSISIGGIQSSDSTWVGLALVEGLDGSVQTSLDDITLEPEDLVGCALSALGSVTTCGVLFHDVFDNDGDDEEELDFTSTDSTDGTIEVEFLDPKVGGFVRGTFSGTVVDDAGNVKTLSEGRFNLKLTEGE